MTDRATISLALLTFAFGCRSDRAGYLGPTALNHPSNIFYTGTGSEPAVVDPGQAYESVGIDISRQLFEGLYTYDPKTAGPTPGVATHHTVTADGLKYVFYLRKNAKWSDGKPVTAHDFVWAWRRNMLPALAIQYGYMMHDIKNAAAINQGGLSTVDDDTPLRSGPEPGAPIVATIKKGAPFTLLPRKGPKPKHGEPPPEFDRVSVKPAPAPAISPAREPERTPIPNPSPPSPLPAPKPLEGYIPAASHRPAWEALAVRAADDHTLEVELERPIPFFLELTQFTTFAPIREDVVVKWATPTEREQAAREGKPYLLWISGAWWRPGRIVTNGAYTLTEWVMNDRFVFEKNPHYWDHAKVKIDKVVSVTTDDSHAVINLYKGGQLDYPGTNSAIPVDMVAPISKMKDYVNAAYLGTYFYWINVNADPVKNVAVRRALNMAINKKALCEKVMRGGQTPATALVPPGTGQGYQPPAGDSYDVARAKQILTEAGFPGGKGLPKITLLYNTEEGHRKIAEAIHQMWKVDLGIDAAIENQEWKVFNRNLESGFYQIGRMGWIGDYNDPFTFLSILLSTSEQNNAKWKNKAFDDLLDKAARERDLKKRYALYREAEEIILKELPILPIYTYRRQSLVRPYVRGWYPNILDIHLFKDMWLDET